jgi:3'(2'), 5'-bisphosphate nucleotidase
VPTLDAAACADLMEALTTITVSASLAILQVGGQDKVRSKADGSPLTPADEAADASIRAGLEHLVPAIPVISEERFDRATPDFAATSIILVDPLDGTRDFVAGRDEYTVNIAVLSDGAPLLGVIAAPALGLIWRGIVGHGAARLEFTTDGRTSKPRAIAARRPAPDELTVMVSRSHLEARTKTYVDALAGAKRVPCGSSIKFCRLAEGSADVYPRLAPTHDWDIAAGHAILKAAGGSVTAPDGAPLTYGSKDLLIPAFLAWADPASAVSIRD